MFLQRLLPCIAPTIAVLCIFSVFIMIISEPKHIIGIHVSANQNTTNQHNAQDNLFYIRPLDYSKYSSYFDKSKLYPNISLIIYAKFRTGSSFTSDFFNKHEQIYNIFEPLTLLPKQDVTGHSVIWLRRALNCQLNYFWEEAERNTEHKGSLEGWKRKIFCYKLFYEKKKLCEDYSMIEYETLCKSYTHRVIKEIHIETLEELWPMAMDNVQILHLVRDPRGVIASIARMVLPFNFTTGIFAKTVDPTMLHMNLFSYTKTYCEGLRKDLEFVTTTLQNSYRNNRKSAYFLVRYEDLILKPAQTVQYIYDNLPLSPDKAVTDLISNMVKGPTKEHQGQKEDQFNTYRKDPLETAFSWRKMPAGVIDLVQSLCFDVMETLGYQEVTSKKGKLTQL